MALAEQLFSTLDEETRASLTYKPPSTLKARLVNNLTLTGGNDGKDYQNKSDVEFIVGEERVSFFGRRFVFGLASPWFREKLYTPEKPTQLEIPDVSPDAFRCLFNCAYGLPPDLNIENVMNVLEAARRMQVHSLAGECLGLVGRNMTASNVLTIFNAAVQENILSPALEQQCCAVLLSKPKEVLASDAFLTIDPLLMSKIVDCDFFFVDETTLWQRIVIWAKSKSAQAREQDEDCKDENEENYEVGDQVTLVNGKIGKIAFKGEVDFDAGLYYGIDLGEEKGDTSGTVDGKEYFKTENEDCGVFVKPTRIGRKCVEIELPDDWCPPCKCGATLVATTAAEASNNDKMTCRLCGAVSEGETIVFNCARGRSTDHPGGYSLCENCANQKHEQLKKTGQVLVPDERDVPFLKEVLPKVRFPLMQMDYFMRDIAPLLPSSMVESVLLYKITGSTCVFPTHERRVWGASGGAKVNFTVIAASSEMGKARNIPDLDTKAEWSREAMSAHNGRQYFVCDLASEVGLCKLDMRNYYGDNDTIRTVEVFALQTGIDWSDDEKDGSNWVKQCDFESAKTDAWQKNIVLATEMKSRYWKFVVTAVWGGESNYCCLDHMVLYAPDDNEEVDLKPRAMEMRYTVPAASHALQRAHNIPLKGQDAEWSRVKMSDAGGPQWFIADLGSPARPVSLDLRHRYNDNDTVKDLELWYLPMGVELKKEQQVDVGGAWIKGGEVESAQVTDPQTLTVDINEDIEARYWKFRVTSLYGGGPTCEHYPCIQDLFITCLQPLWTTGLCTVLEGLRLEAPPAPEEPEE